MHGLQKMREEMVKRPMLATFEKLMQPIRSLNGNYQALGYTHSAYKELLAKLVTEFKKSPKALVIRGVEGTSRPSLSRKNAAMFYDGSGYHEEFFVPEEYGIENQEEYLNKELSIDENLEIGLGILKGELGTHREALLFWGCSLLSGFRLELDEDAYKKLANAIDSGEALKRFNTLRESNE